MKQILLLAVIHLLIFHQYGKDKNEALAPKNNKPVKTGVLAGKQDYLFRDIAVSTNDSLLSVHSESPGPNYVRYPSGLYPAYIETGNLFSTY